MAFDAHKLEPLFRLEVGRPGSSYTFVVAERSGLPYTVINRARKKVKKNSLLLEETLTKMEREKSDLGKLLEENKSKEKSLKELTAKYEKNVLQQEQRLEQDNERIRQRELKLTSQLEDKFRRFVKDWREAKNKKVVLDKYNTQLNDRKNVLSQKEQVKQEELLKYNTAMIKKGSKVRLKNGAVVGDVVALDGTKITVLFGNVKTVADISNLTYVENEKKTVKKKDVKKE
jgi:DNA mismatch repair protein MutS2